MSDDMHALPPPGGARGGQDADIHKATLDAASVKGEDPWAQQERERIEAERQRALAIEEEQRYVAARDALSEAQLAQARTEVIRGAAPVAIGGLGGLLLGGPVGAVVGVVGGWLWDRWTGGAT